MLFYIADSLCGRPGSSDSRHIRNLGLDGCLAQLAVVMYAVLSYGGVDDEVNLPVRDHI